MNKILIFLVCLISYNNFAQVLSLSLDTVNTDIGILNSGNMTVDLTGYSTYRLYAVCATEDTKILTAWGNQEFPAVVGTTTHFYNSSAGAITASNINPATFGFYPQNQFDSWVTIDCENSTDCQSPLYQTYAMEIGNFSDLSTSFHTNNNSNSISCVMNHPMGSFWGMTPFGAGTAGPDLKILLGQFTTNGEIFAQLNLQWTNASFSCGDPVQNVTRNFGDYTASCADSDACNYDPAANPELLQVCNYPGCDDPLACNYSPLAACGGGDCFYVSGCMNPNSCNYNPLADCDSGLCFGTPGCDDINACNYNPSADCDDGSCEGVSGCNNPDACNYNPSVTCPDFNLCIMPGCADPTACNYDPDACSGGICTGLSGCTYIDASNYNPAATCDDGSCMIGGCTDPTACNYFALATTDDGSCTGIKGCMNSQACDYNPEASCSGPCTGIGCSDPEACNYTPNTCGPSGYCSYGKIIFFHDINENGEKNILEQNYNDYIMLHIEPLNIDIVTYNSSYYSLSELPSGTYTVTIVENETGWSLTTPQTFEVSTNCALYYIGLNNDQNTPCLMSSTVGSLNCLTPLNGNISYANYTNEPVNISITLQHDEDLIFSSANNNATHTDTSITWTIQNLGANLNTAFSYQLFQPDFNAIGTTYFFTAELTITNQSGEVICSQSIATSKLYTCSFDPNDKYAEPEGYRDEHFILNNQELTYTITFQNSGNAPAQDVIITDAIDSDLFDLSTLQLLNATHPLVATVDHVSETVYFNFNNIQLPSETTDYEASIGSLTFSIMLQNDIAPWTIIENTASIVFDINEPIITSTTHHTIFDCSSLETSIPDISYCEGDTAIVAVDIPYAETLVWQNEGIDIGEGNNIQLDDLTNENNIIHLIASNPLCSRDNEFNVIVHPLPEVEIDFSGNTILGPEGYTYEWYINDSYVPDQNGNTLTYPEDLFHPSFYAWVTDANGCRAMTNIVFVISTDEAEVNNFKLYPNPMSDQVLLLFPSGVWNVEIYNSLGQLIRSSGNHTQSITIDKNEMSSGVYTISIASGNKSYQKLLMVE
jgi:uncharacterized repeat protein (TIGR01451 family)